jgi:hypothetical protein
MMGLFDRHFSSHGKGRAAADPALHLLPWERKTSIYEQVRAHVPASDRAEDGLELLDDERASAGSPIRWAAGAMDGVATHHMGGSDSEAAKALLKLVVDYCQAPSVENKLKVYEHVMQNHTVSVIDPFSQELRVGLTVEDI